MAKKVILAVKVYLVQVVFKVQRDPKVTQAQQDPVAFLATKV
jgi:hypothetical protein